MALMEIFELDSDGVLVPNENWNNVLNSRNEPRGYQRRTVAALGHYIADAVIQRTDGSRLASTAKAFAEAAKPPMREEEVSTFIGAFMGQTDLFDSDTQQERMTQLHRVGDELYSSAEDHAAAHVPTGAPGAPQYT